jgi:hypothetical protein
MGVKKEGLSPTGNVQKRKMMITQFIYICRGTLFSDKFIYIYIELYSKKQHSRFIFTEEENCSVVITICQKNIPHISWQMGSPTNFKETHASAIDHW